MCFWLPRKCSQIRLVETPITMTIRCLVEKALVCCTQARSKAFLQQRLAVTQMRFSIGEMWSRSLKPLVISLFAPRGCLSQKKLSVKLQKKWLCSRKRRWWRRLLLMRLHRIKEGKKKLQCAVFRTAAVSAERRAAFFYMSRKLVVAKHLAAKVAPLLC